MKNLPPLFKNLARSHFPLAVGCPYHPAVKDAEASIPAWRALQPFLVGYDEEWRSLEVAVKRTRLIIVMDFVIIAATPSLLRELKSTTKCLLLYLALEPEFASRLLNRAMEARRHPTKKDLATIAIRKNPAKTNKEIAFQTGLKLDTVTKVRNELSKMDAEIFKGV